MKEKEIIHGDIIDNTKIVEVGCESEMKKSFISYAMAVNVSRAIPDVRDGLKPVHRRILYAMNEIGLTPDKPFKKCATIVGDVLGKYHPHGDSSVYDALVRLAQNFSINMPLVDGHGNFGSVDGDPAAAYRYTEARMSKMALEMLRDIDKETVDFYPNFDDTRMQPEVLPSRYPNLLVNGSDGIAVGMATSIPPHNLSEVIDATCALIDDPDIDILDLLKYVPAPDFPTGALILGSQDVRNAYLTGRGSCILRAKTEIEEYNNGTRSRIAVTEIPYQVNKAKLIKTIADLVKDKKIEGISDIRDESDRVGMRFVIDIKRDANAQVVLNMLFKHTELQKSVSMIFLALDDGTPKIMNLKEILSAYVKHQQDVVDRRTKFDLAKAEDKNHILSGLVIALQNIDEVIAIIRSAKDRAEAQGKLMAAFDLSDKQANAILDIRLHRLTSMEVNSLVAEMEETEKNIAYYKSILADPALRDGIIKEEMLEIKRKFGTERKSEITYAYSGLNLADMIAREDVVISTTHFGYVKRVPLKEYRSQHRGGVGVTAHKPKDEDFVTDIFTCCTHDDLFFFTNFGRAYVIKAFEVPEAARTARGRAIVNLLQLMEGEKITTVLPVTEAQGRDGNLVLATKLGKIKRTALSEFASVRRTGKIAIALNEGDELISAQLTMGGEELIMASSLGKCIRFKEDTVRLMGRTAAGVRSMKIGEDDYIVNMEVIHEGDEVLTVTENGYGKRTDIEEYRVQGRAGSGIKAGTFNEKTGRIAALKTVKVEGDLMLITESGVIIRTHIDEISKIGRAGQGVKIMAAGKLNSKVVGVALTERYEEEEEYVEGEETQAEGADTQTEAPVEAENKEE
ncbi:MAG: DNA gyrase subunit A [Clostridia bacterium]|nr:DNA gyrase subunit A [Clostridia bacterium]